MDFPHLHGMFPGMAPAMFPALGGHLGGPPQPGFPAITADQLEQIQGVLEGLQRFAQENRPQLSLTSSLFGKTIQNLRYVPSSTTTQVVMWVVTQPLVVCMLPLAVIESVARLALRGVVLVFLTISRTEGLQRFYDRHLAPSSTLALDTFKTLGCALVAFPNKRSGLIPEELLTRLNQFCAEDGAELRDLLQQVRENRGELGLLVNAVRMGMPPAVLVFLPLLVTGMTEVLNSLQAVLQSVSLPGNSLIEGYIRRAAEIVEAPLEELLPTIEAFIPPGALTGLLAEIPAEFLPLRDPIPNTLSGIVRLGLQHMRNMSLDFSFEDRRVFWMLSHLLSGVQEIVGEVLPLLQEAAQ